MTKRDRRTTKNKEVYWIRRLSEYRGRLEQVEWRQINWKKNQWETVKTKTVGWIWDYTVAVLRGETRGVCNNADITSTQGMCHPEQQTGETKSTAKCIRLFIPLLWASGLIRLKAQVKQTMFCNKRRVTDFTWCVYYTYFLQSDSLTHIGGPNSPEFSKQTCNVSYPDTLFPDLDDS